MTSGKAFLFAALLLAATLNAAEPGGLAREYKPIADKLIDAALADTEGYARLTYLCDRIGNRISGSASLAKAVTWAEEQMRKDGLANVQAMPVKVPHWVRGAEEARMLEPFAKPLKMLGLGMSVGTPSNGITAPVVVVDNFDELSSLGKDKVAGKIVLFNVPYTDYGKTVMYRAVGASRAAAVGAVAVLVRSVTPLAMQMPHTGGLIYAPNTPKIPAAAITIEDAELIARLSKTETVQVKLSMEAHQEPDADSANVLGEIVGREKPEEVVVLGGHLDSWDVGQGAQDDGSGVIATLQAVALIKKAGLQPRRTIRVVFWTNEENGTRGGQAYRKWVGDKIGNHVAAIEMDEGAEKPLGFGYGETAPGQTTLSPSQQGSVRTLEEIGTLLRRIGADKIAPGGGGADISPLTRDGVPGLNPLTTGEHYFDWHHTEADTLDKVNPEEFRKHIASLAVMTYVLADMPERLAGSKGPGQ